MNYSKGRWTATTYGGNTNIEAERKGRKCWIARDLYDQDNEPTIAELEANAHLISAAPDMYEALKTVLRLIEGENLDEQFGDETEEIRDAIAKAEGVE